MSRSQRLHADARAAFEWRRSLLPRARAGILAVLVLASASALAASVHRIAQKGRAFAIADITIAPGDTVQFTNDDEFLHQI